jgi:hypothetical protein
MQDNWADPSAVPPDCDSSERAFLEEANLQRCIESLQWIICDLLFENEKLRQVLLTR